MERYQVESKEMIKFCATSLILEQNGIRIVLSKMFFLHHKDGSSRIFKNENNDLLIFTSGEIQIVHGSLLIRILDPDMIRELRGNFS